MLTWSEESKISITSFFTYEPLQVQHHRTWSFKTNCVLQERSRTLHYESKQAYHKLFTSMQTSKLISHTLHDRSRVKLLLRCDSIMPKTTIYSPETVHLPIGIKAWISGRFKFSCFKHPCNSRPDCDCFGQGFGALLDFELSTSTS